MDQKTPRNQTSRLATVGALLLGLAGTAAAQQSLQLTRQDQKAVAVTAYTPGTGTCRGIAIISPGAGGSETGYRYLGDVMASLGYMSLVVGHQESGRDAVRDRVRGRGLREGLATLITEPEAYRGRFMDIAAARRWAQERCEGGESVLIGHSMGAATVMMEAGARNKLGVQGDDSFGAYIALSPQGAGSIFPKNAWSDIRKPALLLTGTRDTELGGDSWATRTEPFGNMPPGCKWLGVISGATHLNLAGAGISGKTEVLAAQTIRAFLHGVHKGDCSPPGRIVGVDLSAK
jgi:predicted dienelactone hydrolase